MDFVDKKIMEYVINNSEDEPELLKELAKETYQKILQPRMLSGHPQGRILSLLSKIIRPKRILEIGTYMGHSVLIMLLANPKIKNEANNWLKRMQ